MIEFKNGSKIEGISSFNNVRSKRSELIGFYCALCNDVHEDYPIKNIRWIDDNMVCKESYEQKNIRDKKIQEIEKNIRDKKIQEIAKRLYAITGTSWHYKYDYDYYILNDRGEYIAQTTYDDLSTSKEHNVIADTEFIAHAPDDVRYLIESYLELQEQYKMLENRNKQLLDELHTLVEERNSLDVNYPNL
jgi:ABC-type antimicrobial peptide transport system permease subunit